MGNLIRQPHQFYGGPVVDLVGASQYDSKQTNTSHLGSQSWRGR